MDLYRDTWAEVNLDHIAHNVHLARNLIGPEVQLMVVVKADAYGHGAREVSHAALQAGADWVGVATLDEAIALRNAGISVPILVLGYVSADCAELAAQHDVTLTLVSVAHARSLAKAEIIHPLSVHLKVDTGMGRLGVLGTEEVEEVVHVLKESRASITGAFTHFAQADSADKTHASTQLQAARVCFERLRDLLPADAPLTFHTANSAAIIDMPQSYLNMVRLGISLYGVYPSDAVNQERMTLRQALSLHTRIVLVKRVPAGTTISYGSTFRADREMTVATLPIGYADGLFRVLSNRGFFKVRGERCPILGRVCMDQVMIDVSHIDNVKEGEVATLYDRETLPILSEMAGTIPYELLCAISKRVPRVYIQNGVRVQIKNEILG